MGRIRFDTAVTLNGFLADEHHSLSWLFAVPGSDDAERDIPTPDAAVDVLGSLARVFDQDEYNLAAVQRGLLSTARTGITLSSYQESRIRHFHSLYEQWVS